MDKYCKKIIKFISKNNICDVSNNILNNNKLINFFLEISHKVNKFISREKKQLKKLTPHLT